MTVDDREILLLHRDTYSKSILASRIPRSFSSARKQFPTAFLLHDNHFIAHPTNGPFQVTFWNHLRRSIDQAHLISGFQFYFTTGNDDIVLNSPFCRSVSTNLRIVTETDGAREVQILLTSGVSGVESDCCQAFGSHYYSDGENVAIAMFNWCPINEYEFPILTDSVSAIEW